MPISEKDRELMKQVADYFESTRKAPNAKYKAKREDSRSINDTAAHFNITRTKATKMLITMGVIETPLSQQAQELRKSGMTVTEIAETLGVSVGTVSSNLPYEDEIHGSDEVSDHAAAMREYRAYERAKAERQVQRRINADKGEKDMDTSWKDEWKKDVKMSYTATDTRPPRMTWEEADAHRMMLQSIHPEFPGIVAEFDKKYEEEQEEYHALLEKQQLEPAEQERLAELEREYGFFAGALADRNMKALEEISGERLPFQPREVLHLHLELQDWWNDEEREKARKNGKMAGNHISRDVVVPSDMPLYAIHYMMQRLFGWENSHLHEFELGFEDAKRVTGDKANVWRELIGIIFRSPLMSEEDEFWADDYESGSFKNWLIKKYTGPYLSQCHGEGIFACREDMEDVNEDEEYYVQTVEPEGRVIDCIPVKGNKPPEKDKWVTGEQKLQKLKWGDLPVDAVRKLYERNTLALLERLPIDSILRCLDDDEESNTGAELLDEIGDEVKAVLRDGEDSPILQIRPMPVTSTIYYKYDFGDNWTVAITATRNCEEMVKAGIITQDQLDKASIKCRELYRPVTIAVDGEMLVDDVGGTSGFLEFLEKVNPDMDGMDKDEKAAARAEKKEYLDWAKSLGWHRLSPWI